MVLLGLEVLFATYVGTRINQRLRNKNKSEVDNSVSKKELIKSTPTSLVKAANLLTPKTGKETEHYLKASTFSLALIASSYLYPPITILAIISTSYITVPILGESIKSLSKKELKNNLLISLVSIGCFLLGSYFTAALAAWFYHLGDKMVAKTQAQSKDMLTDIFGQQPSTAWIIKEEVEIEVSLESIMVDEIIVVSMGQVIPIDGEIINGVAMIDEHVLTGESMPIEKYEGNKVFASTLVLSGNIKIKVTQTGTDTNIAKITDMLEQTIEFKTGLQTRAEQLTDNIAKPLLVTGMAFIPFVGIPAAMTILYSSPGSDIKVLTSLQTLSHLTEAYQQGILIKDGRALESLLTVDTVLFDKTGTLTSVQPKVGRIITCDDFQEQKVLTYTAAAEYKLTHPIALAILAKAKSLDLTLPKVDNTHYKISYGITVELNQQVIKVGSLRFIATENIDIPFSIEQAQEYCDKEGHSLVLLAVDGVIKGAVEIHSQIRSEAHDVIKKLRKHGIKYMAIVSGDREQPTKKLAQELGMDDYFYDFLPQDKATLIEKLQQEGKQVCFIGDGINDSIAMKKANVSISMQGAASIATDTAQIVLMNKGINHLPYLFQISKCLDDKVKQTLYICGSYGVANLLGAIFLHASIMFSFTIGSIEYAVGILNTKTKKTNF